MREYKVNINGIDVKAHGLTLFSTPSRDPKGQLTNKRKFISVISI